MPHLGVDDPDVCCGARHGTYAGQVSIDSHVNQLERHVIGGAQRSARRLSGRDGGKHRGGEGAGVGRHARGLALGRHAVVCGKDDEARRGQARLQAALQRTQPHRPLLQQAQRACACTGWGVAWVVGRQESGDNGGGGGGGGVISCSAPRYCCVGRQSCARTRGLGLGIHGCLGALQPPVILGLIFWGGHCGRVDVKRL